MKKFLLLLLPLFIVSCNLGSKRSAREAVIIAQSCMEENPDSALLVLESVLEPDVLPEDEFADYNLLLVEIRLRCNENIEASDQLIDEVLEYYKKKENKHKLTKATLLKADILSLKGNIEESIKRYSDASTLIEGSTDYDMASKIYGNFGLIYLSKGQLNMAIELFDKSIESLKKLGNKRNLCKMYLNNAYAWHALATEEGYNKAIEICSIVGDIALENKDTVTYSDAIISKMGAYLNAGDFNKAKEILKEASKYNRSEQLEFNLTQILINEGKLDSAKKHLNAIIQKQDSIDDKFYIGQIYNLLSEINETEKDYHSALENQRIYYKMLDSLLTLDQSKMIAESELKYNSQRLKGDNLRLTYRNRTLWFLISIISLAAIVITAIYFVVISFKNRKIANNKLFITKMLAREDKLKGILAGKFNLSKNLKILFQVPDTDHRLFHMKFKQIFGTTSLDDQEWNGFLEEANLIYYGIADHLRDNYNLTPENVKFACMICAGFDAGDISTLLNINYDTIYVKRSRIRHKLGLAEKENLYDFFVSLVNKLREENIKNAQKIEEKEEC